MKTLLIAGLFCGLLLVGSPVSGSGRGTGGVTVSGNGDVNADEGLDLSDAIYLLAHLFQGGPAPEPCPAAAGGAGGVDEDEVGGGGGVDLGLPDTGLAQCWDSDTARCLDQRPFVIEQDCGDGVDNDNDGRTDCADPDCDVFGGPAQGCFNERDAPGQTPGPNCSDGVDNDGDNLTDCDDPDCAIYNNLTGLSCDPPEMQCADGVDNNDNGLTDCEDPGCIGAILEGNPIACTVDPPCPGQDGFYSTGCPSEDRYGARNVGTDETVLDRCTGLMWTRGMGDLSGDGTVDEDSIVVGGDLIFDRTHSWCEALRYCDNLTYAGFDDWRLPNARELESLADRRGPLAAVFASEGQNFRSYYWSSTPSLLNPVDGVEPPTATMGGSNTPLDPAVPVPTAWTVDLGAGATGVVTDGVNPSTDAITFPWACGGNLVRAVRTSLPGDFGAEGAGGVTVSGNGDVNADNGLDLSDAIYLLAHLFQGGPPPEPCPGAPQTETSCDDNVDNDLDSLTDCEDPDCAGLDGCPMPETDCTNGEDDDEDGTIDCDDSDCSDDVSCPEDCEDGVDNDADGNLDCSDSECTGEPQCETTTRGSLPPTGVTNMGCYDENGASIACANDVNCPGQDGDYLSGCSNNPRFVDNGDDTVTDTCTQLMWQKDMADTNGGGVNNSDKLFWCDALTYCEDLTFAGQSDWRLPNVRELHTLVDFSRASPAIDTDFFDATSGGEWVHWTSTSIANANGDCEWLIFFDTGRLSSVCTSNEQALGHIRAVRDAP